MSRQADEPLIEKLPAGGTRKFLPSTVSSTVQGSGIVTVTLTGGESFIVTDEQLVRPDGLATWGAKARIDFSVSRLTQTVCCQTQSAPNALCSGNMCLHGTRYTGS